MSIEDTIIDVTPVSHRSERAANAANAGAASDPYGACAGAGSAQRPYASPDPNARVGSCGAHAAGGASGAWGADASRPYTYVPEQGGFVYTQTPYSAHAFGEEKPRMGNRIGGVVQTAVGAGLMVIGVPMLILPGPGIAALAGGALLAGSGIRKILTGKKGS